MDCYNVNVVTGTAFTFQVPAHSEADAIYIMDKALREHPEEIFDVIASYGEPDTESRQAWYEGAWNETEPDLSEVAPGIYYESNS